MSGQRLEPLRQNDVFTKETGIQFEIAPNGSLDAVTCMECHPQPDLVVGDSLLKVRVVPVCREDRTPRHCSQNFNKSRDGQFSHPLSFVFVVDPPHKQESTAVILANKSVEFFDNSVNDFSHLVY